MADVSINNKKQKNRKRKMQRNPKCTLVFKRKVFEKILFYYLENLYDTRYVESSIEIFMIYVTYFRIIRIKCYIKS